MLYKSSLKVLMFVMLWIFFGNSAYTIDQGKVIEYKPKITSVLVYPDRALVTRNQQLDLGPGKYTLSFENANPSLVTSSLRAFSNNSNFIIQGIRSYLERKSITVDPKVRKMEKELQGLENKKEEILFEKKRLKNDLRSIKKYRKYLSKVISKLSAFHGGNDKGPLEWGQATTFILKRILEVKELLQRNNVALREMDEKITMVKRQIHQKVSSQRKSVRIVEISLQVNKFSSADVSFSYIIYNASWNVSYGMYLKEDGTILVEYYGDVRQVTGEDWKNVTLKLSTSTPSHGAQRPALNPQTIYAQKKETRTVYQQMDKKVAEESIAPGGVSSGSIAKPRTSTGDFTELEDTGASLVFKIKLPANIPSSTEVHRVTITRFDSPKAELGYRIVASKRKIAYLTGSFIHGEPFPLLKGKVDIYRQSGFMGRSSIPFTPSGSKLTVSFGVERSIKLKREVFHVKKTTGVLTKEKIFETTLVTQVENHGMDQCQISFFERIPVSQVEEVKVELSSETSANYEMSPPKSGILKWNFSLPSGGKEKITLKYIVTTPRNFPGQVLGR